MNKFLLALGAVSLVGAANAQVFNSLSSWQTAINNDPGAFFNNLNGTSATLTGGSPTITAAFSVSTSSLYTSGSFYGAFTTAASVTINFTGGVRAIGANWFHTNASDAFIANRPVTLTYSDGFVDTFTPASVNDFRGYVSNVVLTSVTISAGTSTPSPSAFASVDNLRASTVPEPATMSALALGAAAMLRRRRKSA